MSLLFEDSWCPYYSRTPRSVLSTVHVSPSLGHAEVTSAVAWFPNQSNCLVAGMGSRFLRIFDIRGKLFHQTLLLSFFSYYFIPYRMAWERGYYSIPYRMAWERGYYFIPYCMAWERGHYFIPYCMAWERGHYFIPYCMAWEQGHYSIPNWVLNAPSLMQITCNLIGQTEL